MPFETPVHFMSLNVMVLSKHMMLYDRNPTKQNISKNRNEIKPTKWNKSNEMELNKMKNPLWLHTV